MLEEMGCCGVREVSGIQNYKTSRQVIQKICADIFDDCFDGGEYINFAFIIFTDTSDSTSGRRLCKYIHTNKLGEVIESKYGFNPNSENKVRVWVWRLDSDKLTKWWKKNKLSDKLSDDDIESL